MKRQNKERYLQEEIKRAINLTSSFHAWIIDVKPLWNAEKRCWMKSQADSGVADLIIIGGSRILPVCLEVKLPGKKQSPAQVIFELDFTRFGGKYRVVHSVKEALSYLYQECNGQVDYRLGEMLEQL